MHTPKLYIVTRYPDDEPCTWPVVVTDGASLHVLGRTDCGTVGGITSYAGQPHKLVPVDYAPHWTELVPVQG